MNIPVTVQVLNATSYGTVTVPNYIVKVSPDAPDNIDNFGPGTVI